MAFNNAILTTYAAFFIRASRPSRSAFRRLPNTISSAVAADPAASRRYSSFQPAAPPLTFGAEKVFPDIDFSVASYPSSESVLRNLDENAVFVVTGASRGIGLQFVKSLLERTSKCYLDKLVCSHFISIRYILLILLLLMFSRRNDCGLL
jgi:hypothetical protein